MQKQYFYFVAIILFLIPALVMGNNVQISNVTLTNDSTINFNISWENSWRVGVAPDNHDAVWVFLKRRDCASGQWSHVDLSSTVANHSTAAPLEIYIDGKDVTNAKGVFLRRSADGTGNIASTAISLRMTALPVGQYDFRVFGIEMVQIPQDSFQLGDGNISTGSFRQGNTTNPYKVTSEGAISVSTAAGNLYTSSTSYRPLALPANYPKGFAEVYCMKHEISQGQYVDFVNTLTSDQAAVRQITGTANRLNITGTWPVLIANTPHRAMNFLAWSDFLAYLDWSALRPMTDLEYEKICRGPVTPVAGEFAWGTSIITDANTLVTDGTATEQVSNAIIAGGGIANYNNNAVLGPIRCGFAAKAATSRRTAGATYYGVMEMSGNLWESVVSTRNTAGVAFVGNVGDGTLSVSPSAGYANQPSWPSATAITTSSSSATGKGQRGGSWNEGSANLRISDRALILSSDGRRFNEYGGRGVR
jgi:formylglycine-generating enzyme required for sulfatase activity